LAHYRFGGPKRFAHQRKGLALLIRERGGALLFDPGTGKTAVVIDYSCLLALKAPSGEARVLVVCPLAAVDTWVSQVQTFASPDVVWWAESLGGSLIQRAEALAARGGNPWQRGRKQAQISRSLHHRHTLAWAASQGISQAQGPDALRGPRLVLEVVNVDSFASRARRGASTVADLMLEAVRRFSPDLMVVDESHLLKSPQSNTSRLIGRIGPHVPRRAILTGTVMPHSPLDVFGQWRFLDPSAFAAALGTAGRADPSYGRFRDRYAVMGGWMGKQVVGFRHLDELQDVMARKSEVVRKVDALDLPPTTDVLIPVDLSPNEKAAYASMKSQLAAMLASGSLVTAPNRLTQMLRLRQITAGHLPDDLGNTIVLGDSKARTIASLVRTTLAGETRIVVFALFTAEIDQLARLLGAEPGSELMVIQGGTPPADRRRMRERFGSESPQRMVMLAQVRTMSLAVNELVTANHAIFASMSQKRDDYEQARARLDRQGQTRPVTFWLTQAPGTVDEIILRTHQQRGDLEAAILQHIRDSDSVLSPPY